MIMLRTKKPLGARSNIESVLWVCRLLRCKWMPRRTGGLNFRPKTACGKPTLETVPPVTARLALSQAEDIGQAEADRHECNNERAQQRRLYRNQPNKEQGDTGADAAHEPP